MGSNKKKLILNITVIACSIFGMFFLNYKITNVKADTSDIYKHLEVFTEVLSLVEDNYVEPRESEELIYGAIKGLVKSLDPHSLYMTKEEHDDLLIATEGSFTGIGVQITVEENVLTVVSPIEDTPAYDAGLKAGDKIVKIGDKITIDMSLTDAVKLIRGNKGTKVTLTISREGVDNPLVFEITRDVIPLRSVKSCMLDYDIGYIRITNFQGQTAEDLVTALDGLEEEQQLKGLILDLRNNPGGLLDQAVMVSDEFLDSGLIVSTKGRNEDQDMEEYASENKKERNYPMIVLVNGGSASASEIVAGALQDNKRALILGTRTFGKGSVQTVLSLSDGSGLRLTTARYYTPGGRSIQLSGISPDIEIPYLPQDKLAGDETPRFMREEDLEGHMRNEELEEGRIREELEDDVEEDVKVNEDIEEDVEKEEEDSSLQLKAALEKDNQVLQAVQLLKSWDVISGIKASL